MMKFIITKDVTYNGKLYRGRKIIGTDDTLALIYPLIGKAIFTSGWRSKAEQAEMVKKGVSKTMDSNHRRGVAYDIYNWKDMEVPMNKIGFINDLKPWDPGHFPIWGESKARKNFPIIDTLPTDIQEFNPSEEFMKPTKKLAEAYKDLVGKDSGDNMNDGEQDNFAEKIQELRNQPVKEVIKEVPVEVIKEIVVEKVVELPATQEQVEAETRSAFQRLLDLIFRK